MLSLEEELLQFCWSYPLFKKVHCVHHLRVVVGAVARTQFEVCHYWWQEGPILHLLFVPQLDDASTPDFVDYQWL